MIKIKNINYYIKSRSILYLLLLPFLVMGQQEITLEQAISLARSNNQQIKSDLLKSRYYEAMVGTANQLAPMNISSEWGQFNSAYFDTGFGASQTFSMPKVYKGKKAFLAEESKLAFMQQNLSELDIRYQLQMLFQQFRYLNSKESLLMTYYNLFQNFEQRTKERLKAGETDIIENMLALQQEQTLYFQLEQVKNERKISQLAFNLLVNDSIMHQPKTEPLTKLDYVGLTDAASNTNHPLLLVNLQNIEIAKAKYELEKLGMLPEFSIGYNNISIRGIGANDIRYNASNRFSSVGIGIAIPIFRKSIKAGIHAALINESIEEAKAEQVSLNLKTKILQLQAEYDQLKWQLEQMETKISPNAIKIRETATTQFQNGQINYIEYVTIMGHTHQTEIQYLDAVKKYNDLIVELLYHTQNF